MHSAEFLGLMSVIAGVLIAFGVGRKVSGRAWLATIFLLLGDVFLGALLMAAVMGLHFSCNKIGICAKTTDTSVWAVAYPLMAIPAYWLSTLAGVLTRPTASTDGPRDSAS